MFGIFYLIANTIGTIFSGTKAAIQEQQHINWWKDAKEQGKNPHNLYMDRHGTMRSLNNTRPVTITHLYRTGDIIRKEGCSDTTYTNLSAEWREKEFQRIRNETNEHTVFPDVKIIHAHPSDVIDLEEHKWDDRWYAEGQWWRDFKTSALYCTREIDGRYNGKPIKIECYMDISSGLLVRASDVQAKKSIPMDIYTKVITDFNDKRKGLLKPKTLYEWNNYYLNHRIVKGSDYFYLKEVLDEMNKAGCCPV